VTAARRSRELRSKFWWGLQAPIGGLGRQNRLAASPPRELLSHLRGSRGAHWVGTLLDISSQLHVTSTCRLQIPVQRLCSPLHIMAAVTPAAHYDVTPAPFPAQTKTASSTINGTETTATLMSFADKILITVTQQGRLAHWVSCLLMGLIIDFGI
jgi:hypothetical protein